MLEGRRTGMRVNTISRWPLRMMSALAVGGFNEIIEWIKEKAPLRRNITGREMGATATFVLSDPASGITGQNIDV